MKRLIDVWMTGVNGIVHGVSVSFYTFFTIVFSEIIYAWFFIREKALLLTIVLVAYMLAICVCGYFKKIWTGTKKELIFARVFLIVITIVFVAGCFVDWLINIVFFVIPVVVAALMVLIRDFQIMRFVTSHNRVVRFVCYMLGNFLGYFLADIIIIAVPLGCICYVFSLLQVESLVIGFIIIGYAAVIPLIVWLEEDFVSDNIFELAYDVLWSKEFEKEISELEKLLDSSPEKKEKNLEALKDFLERFINQG